VSHLDLPRLRKLEPAIVCLGSHPSIIQSMLDFDFLAGHERPSVRAIVATGRRIERYFFGNQEVVIPVYSSAEALPASTRKQANLVLSLSSGRRVLAGTLAAFEALPNLVGGSIFAEEMPERQALELYREAERRQLWLAGAASVGLVIPGIMKLGAIGGIEATHLQASRLLSPGSVAVMSTSGGMVNEIIRSLAVSGHGISFAVALGGEHNPMLTPEAALLAAEADPATETVVYFGELGERDEYRLAELVRAGKVTKPILAYIAGSVAELFASPPQFGHAKAMAGTTSESARAKTEALRAVGVHATTTYSEFVEAIYQLTQTIAADDAHGLSIGPRKSALFVGSISRDVDGQAQVLGQDLLSLAEHNSFSRIVISLFLGRTTSSAELESFVDFCLRLLVDHGPYVSGAVNTMITARAGRDLVSALASGLLTIGPRFGGAINEAAAIWLQGVTSNTPPAELVESLAARHSYIAGIGHRKYRTDLPDPRVQRLLAFAKPLKRRRFTKFALAIEAETTRKKGGLILNVDGAMAAVMLDLLSEKEGYTDQQLTELVQAEFFNALFVLSRSVGLMAHYFDQRRHDEGLFRLEPDQVTPIDLPETD
jgi:ATP citrate (pro-S)-lyase